MEYILISASEQMTAQERANHISALLWDIVKHPESVGTTKLFGTVTHPEDGRVAMQCIMDYPMPLQNADPLENLVDELSDTVGVEEAAQWTASMIGNTVTFGDLLPEGVDVLTKEQLENEGWFETEEMI